MDRRHAECWRREWCDRRAPSAAATFFCWNCCGRTRQEYLLSMSAFRAQRQISVIIASVRGEYSTTKMALASRAGLAVQLYSRERALFFVVGSCQKKLCLEMSTSSSVRKQARTVPLNLSHALAPIADACAKHGDGNIESRNSQRLSEGYRWRPNEYSAIGSFARPKTVPPGTQPIGLYFSMRSNIIFGAPLHATKKRPNTAYHT